MTALALTSSFQALHSGFAEVTGPAPQLLRVVGVRARSFFTDPLADLFGRITPHFDPTTPQAREAWKAMTR